MMRKILFQISFPYEEREVENIIEDLEQAGAHYDKLEGIPGGFELSVPEDTDYDFCLTLLQECPSFDKIVEIIQQDVEFLRVEE